MKKVFLFGLFALFLSAVFTFAGTQVPTAPAGTSVKPRGKIVVIPVHGEINKANWYIFRRGTKKAVEDNAAAIILDVNTPGGDLSVTLDYIAALQKFPGKTIAFVNPDAISAGAYISGAAEKIFFSPTGKIGAAAVVSGNGEDVDKTMKMKIDSYLSALTKTFSKENPRRADVLRAMFDSDYVLKINGEVLKDKNGDPVKPAGTLLTLTADEAMLPVGTPASPLFGSGIYETLDTMLAAEFADTPYTVEKIEPLGLERLAQLATPFLPILLGLGMLLIFIEIKSPGFGVPGISGIILIGLYFALQHAAGLAGHEGVLLFLVGIVLLLVEIFLMPGIFVFAIAGLVCIVAGIFWSGVDFWRLPDGSYEFDRNMFSTPLEHLGIAVATIFTATLLAWKLLPAKWFRDKIVLRSRVGELEDSRVQGARSRDENLPEIGATGTALTDFRPLGIVKINEQQFEASAESGAIQRGDTISVVGFRDFELVVRKIEI